MMIRYQRQYTIDVVRELDRRTLHDGTVRASFDFAGRYAYIIVPDSSFLLRPPMFFVLSP